MMDIIILNRIILTIKLKLVRFTNLYFYYIKRIYILNEDSNVWGIWYNLQC